MSQPFCRLLAGFARCPEQLAGLERLCNTDNDPILKTISAKLISKPGWRNWQTQRT
jgi:hypothetical protein